MTEMRTAVIRAVHLRDTAAHVSVLLEEKHRDGVCWVNGLGMGLLTASKAWFTLMKQTGKRFYAHCHIFSHFCKWDSCPMCEDIHSAKLLICQPTSQDRYCTPAVSPADPGLVSVARQQCATWRTFTPGLWLFFFFFFKRPGCSTC